MLNLELVSDVQVKAERSEGSINGSHSSGVGLGSSCRGGGGGGGGGVLTR